MPDPLTDKFKTLEEKVKACGPDADGSLVIKISRRESLGVGGVMRPTLVCSLGGASIAHAISPEVWLPRLLGGGRYTLAVFAPGVSTSPMVDGIDAEFTGQPLQIPDLNAPNEDGWAGPKQIIYPILRPPPRDVVPPLIQSPPGASSSPSTSAPQTPSLGSGGSNPGAALEELLRREREQHQAQISALNQRLADEQRKRELEEIRNGHKREMDAMRAEMRDLLQKAVPPPAPPPTSSVGDLVERLLPAVLPVITSMMTASAERDRRAEERQNEVLKALATRPVIPPEIKELMEASRAEQLPVTTILQQTAQSTAAMATQMLAMAREVAEMQSGPEESAAIKAIREVGSAVQGIMSASASAPSVKPRRLPKAEGAPSAPIAAPPPNQALGEVIQMPRPGTGAPPLTLAQIKDLLLQQQDVETVAQECVKSFETPEFQKALEAAQHDPGEMFKTLMTAEWLVANAAYATAFGQAFMRHGRTAKIFVEEGEEEEDDAE